MRSLLVQKLGNVEFFSGHFLHMSTGVPAVCRGHAFLWRESCEHYLNESMACPPGVLITWHLRIQKQQFIHLITSDVWAIQGLNWLFAVVIDSWVLGMFPIFTRGQFWPSGIVVACVCSCGRQSRACPRDNLSLVLARITKFEPDMQNNLVKIPIVLGVDWPWPSRSNLTWKSKFTQFWACPQDHPPPVEVRISKFWPIMHLSSVKIPVNFGIHWYWFHF